MIFITAKFTVKPEHADAWPELTRSFTEATRAEPGNLWFDWARSVDDPTEYVLVEAFRDGDAGSEHVQSDHFAGRDVAPPAVPRVHAADREPARRAGRLGRPRRDARRLSRPRSPSRARRRGAPTPGVALLGVTEGFRTPDLRDHNPAL